MDLLKPLFRVVEALSRRFVIRGLPANVRAEKLAHFQKIFAFFEFNDIRGDILEFGVAGGRALELIDRCARKMLHGENAEYRLFGFDSFEGLPEPRGRDRDGHLDPRKAENFNRGEYSADSATVLARLRRQGVDLRRVRLIEGWYDAVLTPALRQSLGIERATMIDIDCDFYESTRVALSWCEPLIRQGTIINFDDWFCYEARRDHGERAAFAEFLEKHPDVTVEPYSSHAWCARSFLVHRTG